MKKTPVDKLGESLSKILDEYAEETYKDVSALAKKFAQKGAQAVRQEAKSKGWGEHTDYDKGWTSRFETGRLSAQGVIYNKDVPGLPHLLENGHALRNGGRSKAFPHIGKIEEMITEEFEKAVKNDIQRGV